MANVIEAALSSAIMPNATPISKADRHLNSDFAPMLPLVNGA